MKCKYGGYDCQHKECFDLFMLPMQKVLSDSTHKCKNKSPLYDGEYCGTCQQYISRDTVTTHLCYDKSGIVGCNKKSPELDRKSVV